MWIPEDSNAPMFKPKPLTTIEGLGNLPFKDFVDETSFYVVHFYELERKTRIITNGVIFGKETKRYDDISELKTDVINYIKTKI